MVFDFDVNNCRRFSLLILLVALVMAACGGGATASETGLAAPVLSQPTQSPEDVVRSFLDAWKAGNYEAMYTALSPQSQGLYAFPVFQTVYQDASTAISLSDLSYRIQTAQIQGASAAVTYDVSIQSPVFGTIDDTGRTMRLVQKPGGWGIAWSSMDIFDGLAAGSRLEVTGRRQPRGTIYDRNGLPLVEPSGTITLLYGSQENMSNVDDCLDLLADVLMTQRYKLAARFAPYDPVTIFYLGAVDEATLAARGTELQNICGALINPEFAGDVRHYVLGGGAVHVTGYVGPIQADQLNTYLAAGYSSGELVGTTGIEQQYEDVLSGEPERVLRIISSDGVILRELAGRQGTEPQSVTLAIDRNLQEATANALVDAFNYAEGNWAAAEHSPGAGAVVIDVNTGAVLAMASYPFFDPNVFSPESPIPDKGVLISEIFGDSRQPYRNRAVQEQFFPGSTFKIITLAAALSENVVPPPPFDCQLEWDGRVSFGDTSSPRFDWRRFEPAESPVSNPAGEITPWQALAASCNPFFYEMGARLWNNGQGDNTLVNYARQMGLGGPTGLDRIYGEAGGNLGAPTSVEQAINTAIGQGGIQVTILQMARMVAGVANGGTLYRSYLVQQVGGDNGATPSFVAEPEIVGDNGLSDAVLEEVRTGMCAVTTDTTIGTAWFDFEETGYTVCGKTGTAQSGRPEPHGWFVAYAPADNPQIAIAVMVEFSREGSETAGPIVRRILDAYFGEPAYPFPDWWFENSYAPLPVPDNSTGYTAG
jgi:cell division protein FtsI/penicillin-binding protein 2